MADVVTERTRINASREACLAVLHDFERYPEWARDLKQVIVLSRDDAGRGIDVRYRAAGMGYSTYYTLRYDYQEPERLSWKLIEGDLARRLDGHYTFEPAADGNSVDVEYQLEAQLILPLPGFVKRRTELIIVRTALRELKARVETRPAP